jgi:hypothetical protein
MAASPRHYSSRLKKPTVKFLYLSEADSDWHEHMQPDLPVWHAQEFRDGSLGTSAEIGVHGPEIRRTIVGHDRPDATR